MTPGVVGDEFQLHVLGGKASLLVEGKRLGIGGERRQLIGVGTIVSLDAEVLIGQHVKLGLLIDEHAHDIEVVVDSLGTINQRTALDSNHAAIGFHILNGTHRAWLHIEVEAHDVALLPLAVDGQIAVVGSCDIDVFAVYLTGGLQAQVVVIAIEVAGHDVALQPARDANLHGKLSCRVLVDGNGDIAVPRILCLLREAQLLASDIESCAVGQEEVDIHRAVFHGIDISGQ